MDSLLKPESKCLVIPTSIAITKLTYHEGLLVHHSISWYIYSKQKSTVKMEECELIFIGDNLAGWYETKALYTIY